MKFTTTLEAVSSNKSKTTIKLSMSNASARLFAQYHLNSIDKELVVQFEDPQMEMEFQADPAKRGGLVATIDSNGSVERVTRALADEDEAAEADAEEVLVQDGGGDDDQEELNFEESDEGVEEEWDEEYGEDTFPEVDENHDPEPDDDPAADANPEACEEATNVDPAELERYILAVRPKWDDIPYDFPALIEKKKAEDLTWYELAKQVNISSDRLQTAYGQYKKRCKEQILNGAA